MINPPIKMLSIQGPSKINGKIKISGSKNAALPIIVATLLSKNTITLHNIPNLLDIMSILEILCTLKSQICLHDDQSITINNSQCSGVAIPASLAQKTRASIVLVGPLLARFGKATVALPGGCKIGERPIDLHINGLTKLGAQIKIDNNTIQASAPNGLNGAEIYLNKPSVGATENIIMAGTLARGRTILHNYAKDPEIKDLIHMLIAMGANICYNNESIIIEGQPSLNRTCTHTVIGDRIEAGTYLIAATATQGKVTIENINPQHLEHVIAKLKLCGAIIKTYKNKISLLMPHRPKAISIQTEPYPGFPTDLQAQWLALSSMSDGESYVIDTIYKTRLSHVYELQKLNAEIKIINHKVLINGKMILSSSKNIIASDIRASAGLVIAALCAYGQTLIHNTSYLDRGYVAFEEKLTKLGIKIHRITSHLPSIA